MGRVNTEKRWRYAFELGVDSVDGTKLARFNKTYLESTLHFIDGLHRQTYLEV